MEENIENQSCLTTWVDPKIVFSTLPRPPPKSPLRPQKVKKTWQLSENQKSELKNSQEGFRTLSQQIAH